MTIPEVLGKSEGFVAGALILSVITTILLLIDAIDGNIWQQTVTLTWGSVVGGGAVAAFRK